MSTQPDVSYRTGARLTFCKRLTTRDSRWCKQKISKKGGNSDDLLTNRDGTQHREVEAPETSLCPSDSSEERHAASHGLQKSGDAGQENLFATQRVPGTVGQGYRRFDSQGKVKTDSWS